MDNNQLESKIYKAIKVASNIDSYNRCVSVSTIQSAIFIEQFESKQIDFKFNQNFKEVFDTICVYFIESLPDELIPWIEIKMSKLDNVITITNIVSDFSFGDLNEDTKLFLTKELFEKYTEIISSIANRSNFLILSKSQAAQPVEIDEEMLNSRFKKWLPISTYNVFFENIFH